MNSDLKPLDHVITDAAIAIDDPEGFWESGRNLTGEEIEQLNDRTARRETRVIRRNPDGRWLVTTGMGNHYFADVAVRCDGCDRTMWIEEAAPPYHPFHSECDERTQSWRIK